MLNNGEFESMEIGGIVGALMSEESGMSFDLASMGIVGAFFSKIMEFVNKIFGALGGNA